MENRRYKAIMAAVTSVIIVLGGMTFTAGASNLVMSSASSSGKASVVKKNGAGRSGKKKSGIEKDRANSFESPDFAYPRTVYENAFKELKTASAKGDYAGVVKGAIQMTVSNDMISDTNVGGMALMLDSLASTLPIPFRSIMYLVEGKLFDEYYKGNAWTFSQRNLPLDRFPDNVAEWSRDLFSLKILELIEKSTADMDALYAVDVREIEPVLDRMSPDVSLKESQKQFYQEEVRSCMPTVGDFVSDYGVKLLSDYLGSGGRIIPFGINLQIVKKSISERIEDKIDSLNDYCILYNRREGRTGALVTAVLRKSSRGDLISRQRELLSLFGEVRDTPQVMRVLNSIYGMSDFGNSGRKNDSLKSDTIPYVDLISDKKAYYAVADSCVERYPDALDAGDVKRSLWELKRPRVDISGNKFLMRKDSVRLDVELNNVNESYVLVLKGSPMAEERQLKDMIGSLENVRAIKVSTEGSVPFSSKIKVETAPLDYGCYYFVPSSTTDKNGISNEVLGTVFGRVTVTDMNIVTSLVPEEEGKSCLYVVDASTMKPIQGAKVDLKNNRTTERKVTDADGCVSLPEGSWQAIVSKGRDVVRCNIWLWEDARPEDEEETVDVYTDLSIYRPGQSLQFAAIASKQKDRRNRVMPGSDLKAVLRDANWQAVDTLSIKTDEYGRVHGGFVLPDGGLSGTWCIEVKRGAKILGRGSFEVAEYKAPRFYVEMDDYKGCARAGDTIVLRGKAFTYSGMPVQSGGVKFNIKYNAGWFRWREEANNASYAGETETGADGSFEIALDTENLKNTQYECGMFVMEVSVTDGSGETESASIRFSLGDGMRIVCGMPAETEATDSATAFDVKVENLMGESVEKEVNYRVREVSSGQEVLSGSFKSPKLAVDTREWRSGRYAFEFTLAGDTTVMASGNTILYRLSDNQPPVDSCLWVPVKKIVAKEGDKRVNVPVGNSYGDGYVLCEVFDTDRLVSRKWLQPGGVMNSVTVDVPADNSRMYVTFRGMRDMAGSTARVEIVPYSSTNKMKIETVSFRDRITSGDAERWTFRFVNRDQSVRDAAVMAVMSDRSLGALAPFVWSAPGLWVNYSGSVRGEIKLEPQLLSRRFFLSSYRNFQNVGFVVPEIDTYGYGLAGGYGMRRFKSANVMVRGVNAASDNVVMMECAAVPSPNESAASMKQASVVAEEELVDAGEGMATGSVETSENQQPLRGLEHPLAFFKPTMTVDDAGIAEISFEVPNFNTTWDVQLVGWTREMLSSVRRLESVSSKPVMVSTNVPRFLRTGDKSVLKATLYNNTDTVAAVGGRIELFDALTDEVILERDYPSLPVEANGSRVIDLSLDAPDTLPYIGIRAYAYGIGHKDGEQGIIPILPSSSPVIESTPFYIGAEQTGYEVKLPKITEDAHVTLSYCDNPAWVCLTALPSMALETDATVTSKITALYGYAVANGLVGRIPAAKEAIRDWLSTPGDSTLMSPLEKNDNLKILALENTPWVRNARTESLRMLRLGHLLDTKRNEQTISNLISEISKLQNADGGFSWCPGMESSGWVTGRVLLYLGMLRQFGYLPDDPDIVRMLDKGVGYCDRENLKYVRKCKDYPVSAMLNYYYVRTMTGVEETSAVRSDINKCLTQIQKTWRQFGIYDSATAAMLLHRKGIDGVAKDILRSLSEKAEKSDDKGMRYDNLQSRYGGFNKLITTAQVLEAFAEISPEAKETDMLRQWLIIQKQAQEWGDNSYTAEVVNAILTSGSDWLNPASATVLKLNGREISIAAKNNRIGEVTVDLSAKETSEGTLTIEKSGDHPCWGGVITQFIMPSREVKASSTEDISIEKHIYKINEETGETILDASTVSPGDRVRVQLTVTATRDLEYVALTDERCACLAPVEQLSGYIAQDGVYYYREVKNSCTNLFFGYLPQGVTQIWYDCDIDRIGEFTDGIATIQSLYAPTIAGHSSGGEMTVD